ncbi:hypothetical protein KVF89_16780 [Nocardioides carbamazepini]|uniref:hypothetical protein n=1 Tax=Nocardioides carbamazepini TaxID=2854259 RepID=UPI00214A74F3|nr:hypothetical protein [Nocardioides carbamazepini]MCR1784198.1 hypothetical protein [Nocardioides carbamazepini]
MTTVIGVAALFFGAPTVPTAHAGDDTGGYNTPTSCRTAVHDGWWQDYGQVTCWVPSPARSWSVNVYVGVRCSGSWDTRSVYGPNIRTSGATSRATCPPGYVATGAWYYYR